jgi:hypothetical protein
MKKRTIQTNNHAQVLGLPMYLIIVMIVAVAIIAAVLFMIPQTNRTMNAIVTDNAVIAEDPGNAGPYTFSQSYDITIQVQSNGDRTDPVSGAIVNLVGSGIIGSAVTDNHGIATITITPKLEENVYESSVKLIVKANGFEDYQDEDAVMIYRL